MAFSKAESATARRTVSEIASALSSFARARVELRGVKRGRRVRCYGKLEVERRSGLVLGERVVFLGGPIPMSLRCERGAELVIGDRTIFNYGAAVAARQSVRIGTDCMIASHVQICDDDGRRAAPIAIGNGVWLAHGAVVEPGTVIGDGAVVGALAVVSGRVPPHSLVAANPTQTLDLGAGNGAGQDPESVAGPARRDDGAKVTIAEVRQAVIDWLDDNRCFGDAALRIADDAMSLRTAGLLDSLGLVQIVTMLERRFGVTIERKRLAQPEAQSILGLADAVLAGRGR